MRKHESLRSPRYQRRIQYDLAFTEIPVSPPLNCQVKNLCLYVRANGPELVMRTWGQWLNFLIKTENLKAHGWPSRLSFRILISAWVSNSGLWVWSLYWAPWWVWSLFKKRRQEEKREKGWEGGKKKKQEGREGGRMEGRTEGKHGGREQGRQGDRQAWYGTPKTETDSN